MHEARQIQETLSLEDYLEGEKHSKTRHEYLSGYVRAMAGGTRQHNRISLNLASDLERALEENRCESYIGDVKVHVKNLQSDTFYYPDVMVGCDPNDNHELYLENPSVIIEVLSESTEKIDKGEKFHSYKSISTLMEYVLISQTKQEVVLTQRKNDWAAEILTGDDDILIFPSIQQSVLLSRIYRNITFD